MVSLASLWLPILLSAVAVFIVSFIIHMVLRYHNGDLAQLPSEDAILGALAPHNIPAGTYMFPWARSMDAMKDPAFVAKRERGPVGLLTVYPRGPINMTRNLVQWFIFSLVVTVFVAYVTSHALGVRPPAAEIFRYCGTLGFMGYGLAHVQQSVWWNQKWSTTIKNLIDAFLYGATTALVFIWLWPK